MLPPTSSAPSEVRNLSFSHNGSHFVISWAEPAEPNGNLNYTVMLTGFSLVTMVDVLSRTEVVLALEVVLMEVQEVYTRYTAIVVPQTGGGQGSGETATYVSPQQSESYS